MQEFIGYCLIPSNKGQRMMVIKGSGGEGKSQIGVVLSPERKAPQATREYAAHRLDTVLDKFLKTMQTTATRLQEKLLKPEVRQKGKEQVKEKARNSVLQLLNRLQAEQAQNKPAAQPRTQEGHSEI